MKLSTNVELIVDIILYDQPNIKYHSIKYVY